MTLPTGFYLWIKGIIAESGTPDQIFSHAQDERTRLFLEPIRKVQQI